MAAIEQLANLERWDELWTLSAQPGAPHLLVFKRSPTCPISFAAEAEFNRFAAPLNAQTALIISVDVIGARPVSQRIAADTGTRHESPQALLIGPGRQILWTASHGDITQATLKAALAKL
jgi:bacillithiol system protein YtxJ